MVRISRRFFFPKWSAVKFRYFSYFDTSLFSRYYFCFSPTLWTFLDFQAMTTVGMVLTSKTATNHVIRGCSKWVIQAVAMCWCLITALDNSFLDLILLWLDFFNTSCIYQCRHVLVMFSVLLLANVSRSDSPVMAMMIAEIAQMKLKVFAVSCQHLLHFLDLDIPFLFENVFCEWISSTIFLRTIFII